MVCRRAAALTALIAALTALIAALPLVAVAAIPLAEGGRTLAFPQNQAAAPAGLRWAMVLLLACYLGASAYLVGSGTCRAARSWGSLSRFAAQSFRTLGLGIVVSLTAVVLGVAAAAVGGGIF